MFSFVDILQGLEYITNCLCCTKEFLDPTISFIALHVQKVNTIFSLYTPALKSGLIPVVRILYVISCIIYIIIICHKQLIEIICFLYDLYTNHNKAFKCIIILILLAILLVFYIMASMVELMPNIILMELDPLNNNNPLNNSNPVNNGNYGNNGGPGNNVNDLALVTKDQEKQYEKGYGGLIRRLTGQYEWIQYQLRNDISHQQVSVYERSTWANKGFRLTIIHTDLLNNLLRDHPNYRIQNIEGKDYLYPIDRTHKIISNLNLITDIRTALGNKNIAYPTIY